uniref:Uncharacterized protein n=1 Tax=Sphaerodactylus townsendi TaxID=933632 RepID=A0ACB8FL98_9SAUR
MCSCREQAVAMGANYSLEGKKPPVLCLHHDCGSHVATFTPWLGKSNGLLSLVSQSAKMINRLITLIK